MATYKFRTVPYQHQKQAIRKLLKNGYGGALLMEPRTGKTKTTIDWLCILATQRKIDRVVIVAPNRVLGTWVQEWGVHSTVNHHITVWDRDGRKLGLKPVSGMYDLEILLVNYDAFATPGKKTASGRQSKTTGRFKHRAQIRKWIDGKPCAAVLDESHKIKSPSGRAANMLVTMGVDFRYRAILTGTPITKAKRTHDVYMQWKFLNPERFSEWPTLAEFKMHFGRWTDFGGFPKYLGPKNVEQLQELMAKDSVIVRREDCFDLPPREDVVKYVPLKASRQAYEDMAREMIHTLESGGVAEASIALVKNLRLQQITSGFVTTEDGEMERFGFEKSDALHEIMELEYEREQHLVVAARWRADLDLIEAMGREIGYKVYSVRGGVKRSESDKAIRAFRDAKEPSLMVLQPSAASLGIDLSTAAHMVWFSHTTSWVDFTQTCDRIALSRNSTTFTHLVAENSIDEGLLQTLHTDGDVAAAIMKNPAAMLLGHTLKTDKNNRLV